MRGWTTERNDAWLAWRRGQRGPGWPLIADCVRYSTRLGVLQRLVGQLEREGRLSEAERRAFAGALR